LRRPEVRTGWIVGLAAVSILAPGFVLFIDGRYNWQAVSILSRMVGAIASD
jgi:hypothetical protein